MIFFLFICVCFCFCFLKERDQDYRKLKLNCGKTRLSYVGRNGIHWISDRPSLRKEKVRKEKEKERWGGK